MLAGFDDLLGACRSGRERFARRCFGGLTLTARVINALDRIFAMHHPVLTCLALELSVEHSAGEDGYRPIAAESERQHPKRAGEHEGTK
jgi:hypothetical protein